MEFFMGFDSYGGVAEPGEVQELVKKLRYQAGAYSAHPDNVPLIEEWARCFTRAAELLAQCHPQPVAVSERLPGPEDCTPQGWCWVLYRGFSTWTLEPPLGQDGQPTGWTHWLPVHALPTPRENV